ncbi:hypothetical protein FRB99_006789 [Tulasnella sp. 403]|nr:hypothetical protein FRB99_006789 [Tulasnella sp. 403]
MLKLWGPSAAAAEQTTPKAEKKNPFEAVSHPSASATSQVTQPNSSGSLVRAHIPPRIETSASSPNLAGKGPPASGARTPTTGTLHHHHLLHLPPHPSHLSDSSSPRGIPGLPSVPSATALPTTHVTLEAAEFHMKPPPLALNATATAVPTVGTTQPAPSSTSSSSSGSNSNGNQSNGAQSRGQLHVKLIQARGLNVKSLHSRPYVVVQFENNEFVSRDPISDKEKEVKGVPQPLSRNNSSSALTSLAASGIARAFEAASRRSGTATPVADKSSGGLLFGSSMSPHNPTWKHEVSFDVTSDQSQLAFNIYDRTQEDAGFLGFLEMRPVLVHDHTVDQWVKLQPREGETVTGEIRVQVTYEQFKTKRVLTPRDFEFLKLIGRGTFGRVFQVRKKDTRRIYAMKILSKKEIIAKKEVAHTIGERKILQASLECPFLVSLKFSFQTTAELYLVTDFKSGGELFWHLQKEQRFSEERARFYIAELVLALEHLHKYDIVYRYIFLYVFPEYGAQLLNRDLKPENILLDATGHVALCDFGLSKPDLPSDQLTNTFCGTTEYLAPEVLLDDSGYSKLVDFWSLGVLLFEMCCGWSPFYAEDTQTMYRNICFGKIRFPRGVIGEDGKQFVKGLLNRNPRHRLGAVRDAEELKEHPFFKAIDWKALSLKQVTPPFKPNVESDESTANFDPEFTEADLKEQGIDFDDETEDEEVEEAFSGLTMNNTSKNGAPGLVGSQVSTATTVSTATPDTSPVAHKPGVEIQKDKAGKGRGKKNVASSPITSSVQENFRGFTYLGESLIGQAAGLLGEDREKDKVWKEEDVIDIDGNSPPDGDDDDWEDDEDDGVQLKGRYKDQQLGHEILMD